MDVAASCLRAASLSACARPSDVSANSYVPCFAYVTDAWKFDASSSNSALIDVAIVIIIVYRLIYLQEFSAAREFPLFAHQSVQSYPTAAEIYP